MHNPIPDPFNSDAVIDENSNYRSGMFVTPAGMPIKNVKTTGTFIANFKLEWVEDTTEEETE